MPGARKIGLGPVSNVAARNVQDALEEMNTRAGAADASPTHKGITKLSRAAADPANPVAVGDNDPRVDGKAKALFKMGKSSSQTVNSVSAATAPSPTTIAWQTAEVDAGGGVDLLNNALRVPAGMGGYWEVAASLVLLNVEDTSNCQVLFLRNGAIASADNNHPSSPRLMTARGDALLSLAAGDLVTVRLGYNAPTATDTVAVEPGSVFRGEFKGAA